MNYYSLCIEHTLSPIETDLLIDDLGTIGFESFETDDAAPGRLTAYIQEPAYKTQGAAIDALLQTHAEKILSRNDTFIRDQNWNAVWESQYEPVRFGDFCFVHAPFHKRLPEVEYNIEIEPKMSFGTAHHPTTSLMIRLLQEEPPVGKRVLDMGCGTGVLGILAAMQGAENVLGIDIDEWAYKNALENVERNGMSAKMRIEKGDAALLQNRRFDLVIANINRNILLNDMKAYADVLPSGGVLYLSGFYLQDMDVLEKEANSHRLFYKKHLECDSWAAMKFIKK